MDRRSFLSQTSLYALLMREAWANRISAQDLLMGAAAPEPVPEPHFPDRLHLFGWRNWELANTDRMAQVLATAPEKVLEMGYSMGLPKKPHLTDDQLRRIYITAIRQNWHVLPVEQLIELLGWNREHLEYTLKEDDFLWIKLGLLKPRCEKLKYAPPSPEAKRRAAEINQIVRSTFGSALDAPGEQPFDFVGALSDTKRNSERDPNSRLRGDEIDLSRGWSLSRGAEGSEPAAPLIDEFRNYLHSAMGL